MKNAFLIPLPLLVFVAIFMLPSCNKNNPGPDPVDPAPFIQASINGTTYTASTQINVPNKEAFDDYTPSIASNGSYINCTFIDSSTAPYYYHYYIHQFNALSNQDTLVYLFGILSKYPITSGTYKVYGPDDTYDISATTAITFGYGTTGSNFTDSTVTGTITISKIDMTNKVASGTFSLTDKGKSGSSPSQVIVEGKFDNLPLQEL